MALNGAMAPAICADGMAMLSIARAMPRAFLRINSVTLSMPGYSTLGGVGWQVGCAENVFYVGKM